MTEEVSKYRRAALKADYEAVRQDHPEAALKPYDDLNDEEKLRHQRVYEETENFYDRLGKAIGSGGPLPDIRDLLRRKAPDVG